MNVSFTVPDPIGAELLAAFLARWPKSPANETDLVYVRRITRTYFWAPILAQHRRRVAEQVAAAVAPDDFGTN